jgi:hypothetical protein
MPFCQIISPRLFPPFFKGGPGGIFTDLVCPGYLKHLIFPFYFHQTAVAGKSAGGGMLVFGQHIHAMRSVTFAFVRNLPRSL